MSLGVPQLKIASSYVNNLLLARGLLRNGKAIDFASLVDERDGAGKDQDAKRSAKKAERAAEVINLVHDLILRRDREADQLNSLSETITELRSTTNLQNNHLDKLRSQNQDLTRQVSIAQSSLKSAHAALHTAEATAKALKEELVKVKATLVQVRTQCANDVRKRDVQLQRLKGHLSTSQRGTNGRAVGPTCTINTGSTLGKVGSLPTSGGAAGVKGGEEPQPSLEDAEYSLKQETTEFLTQLSQNLSDENDTLISLVRGTLTTLRELQNLPPIGSQNGSQQKDQNGGPADDDMVHIVPTSYEILSADLEYVLGNLRIILTNASFVPIEEVYTRDEEINRLREGWERMESRWREAVEMMKGWQQRMLSGGGTVNLEELKLGLGLGDGLELLHDAPGSPSSNIDGPDDDEGIADLPEDEPSFVPEEDNIVLRTNGISDDYIFNDDEQIPSPYDSSDPHPASRVLKEGTANIRNMPEDDRGAENTVEERENTVISADADSDANKHKLSSPTHPGKPMSNVRDSAVLKVERHKDPSSKSSFREGVRHSQHQSLREKPSSAASIQSPSRPQFRRVAQETLKKDTDDHPPTPEPPLTIEEKLQHAESEARRISGSSFTDSLSPSPAEEKAGGSSDYRGGPDPDAAPVPLEERLEAQMTPVPTTAALAEPKASAEAKAAPVVKSKEPRPPSSTSRITASTAASRAAASGKAGGTLPRRGHASTTRIPTKPAAPDVAPKKREVEKRDAGLKRKPSVESTMRRSRRKRKSTLSPEELEELMGLRQRAEAEGEADPTVETF